MQRKGKTLEQLRQEYLVDCSIRNLSKSTLRDYKRATTLLIDFIGSTEAPGALTKANVYEWVQTLELQPVSLNKVLRDIRAFVRWCAEQGYIQPFKIQLAREQEVAPKHYFHNEVEWLLQRPRKDTFVQHRSYAIICLMLSTGARASTVLNIKLTDLDFSQHSIEFRHTKSKKAQVVPMSEYLFKIMNEYIHSWAITDWLFPTDENGQLSVHGLYTSLKQYVTERGIDFRGVHAFRHAFAYEATINGMPTFSLQAIMRHSSISTTQKYVKLAAADLQGSMDYSPLDKILNEAQKSGKVKHK